MIPYFVIIAFLLVLVIKYDVKGNFSYSYEKTEKVVLLILILFSGLRNRVGGDTINYEYDFHLIPPINELFGGSQSYLLDELSQPLWFLSNSLVRTFTDDFVWFQLLVSIIFNVLLFRFIDKSTKYRFTTILLYFIISWWDMSFNTMRESICVVLYVNSLLELKEGHIKKFLLWNLPSIFVHWFSFPMIFVTLIIYYLNTKIVTVVFLAVGLYCLALVDSTVISEFIILISSIAGENMIDVAESYLDSSMYGLNESNVIGILWKIITSSLALVLLFSKQTKCSKRNILGKIVILYVSISLVCTSVLILMRYLNYLYIIAIVLIVEFLHEKNIKFSKLAKLCCCLWLVIMSYNAVNAFYSPIHLNTSLPYSPAYIPYTSIFQDPDPVRELYFGK